MTWSNSLDWDQLQPTWTHGAGGANDNIQYIYNYGTKIYANNGNNGPAMSGFVKGIARGQFKIQFKLGYAWGWSMFFMADQSLVNPASPSTSPAVAANTNGVRFMNNSSNNKLDIDKNVNGTVTRIRTGTGVSDSTLITLRRDSSNVVHIKVGSETSLTVGTFTNTFAFGCTLQSPSSVELITAINIDDGPS